LIGSRIVPALDPSVTSTTPSTLALPAGTAAGSYYVIAVADAAGAVAESLENNNTRASGLVRIGPDLTVTSLVAPSLAAAGTSITATDTTKNQGGDVTPVSLTRYYLSTNSTFDVSDLPLGSREVSALAPGLSETGSATLLIPGTTPPGNYVIIARSDGADAIAEAEELNNTRARTISITAPP
jgi:subtilase family serine protease